MNWVRAIKIGKTGVGRLYRDDRRGGLKPEGCQYKRADQVEEKKAAYLFSLKGNQET
jgi:hypothetical protein